MKIAFLLMRIEISPELTLKPGLAGIKKCSALCMVLLHIVRSNTTFDSVQPTTPDSEYSHAYNSLMNCSL